MIMDIRMEVIRIVMEEEVILMELERWSLVMIMITNTTMQGILMGNLKLLERLRSRLPRRVILAQTLLLVAMGSSLAVTIRTMVERIVLAACTVILLRLEPTLYRRLKTWAMNVKVDHCRFKVVSGIDC